MNIDEKLLSHLRFTYDIVLISDSKEQQQAILLEFKKNQSRFALN